MANYFTDRVVQYPGRVTMAPVQGETNQYDMSRSEGAVTTEGTPFNADAFNTMLDKYGLLYGTCSTAAGTKDKVVSCAGFELETGATIAVYFSYGNTSTDTLTLNVNNTGAKDIYGVNRSGNTDRMDGAWEQTEIKIFLYDGNVWRIIDQNIITSDQLTALETILGITRDGGRLYKILDTISNAVANVEDITSDISVTASTGRFVSASARKCGKFVQIGLYVTNSGSVAAGSNIFVGTLNPASLRPVIGITGSNFVGQRSIAGQISNNGTITIRNSSASALSLSGDFYIGFAYIIP